jgi:hypothetical protein
MSTADIAELETDPIEIDSRPCGECGCTIDRHRRVDTPEGPEFFCADIETQIHLDAADLVKQWELADPRDRWRHTGEPKPATSDIPKSNPRPYSTPDSVKDAFWYVVSLNDLKRLKTWLANHPADAPTLLELLESK